MLWERFFNPLSEKQKEIDVNTNEFEIIQWAEKSLEYLEEICIELDTSFEEHQNVIEALESKSFEIFKKEIILRKFNKTIANYLFKNKNISSESMEKNN